MTSEALQVAQIPPQREPTVAESVPRRRHQASDWSVDYLSRLIVLDCIAIFLALATAYLVRFGVDQGTPAMSYAAILVASGPAWLAALALHRCYDVRFLGSGLDEFRNLTVATFRLCGIVAITCYVAKVQLARGFVAIAFPLGLVLLLFGRHLGRRWLAARRAAGTHTHRVLAVGDDAHVDHLVKTLQRDPGSGYTVVGACVAGGAVTASAVAGVPIVGCITDVVTAAAAADADTVAVTAAPGITPLALRRMSWALQDTGIGMIVAPGLTDVAGNRISIRPVARLPLLHVDEPELGVVPRMAKRWLDIVVAGTALLLLAPLFALIAVAVRLTTHGPALFRQERVGRNGTTFTLVKFRSMFVDAEHRLDGLRARNECDGLLFKMRNDPRITAVGRWLRRLSLDELPQLWNVLTGDMSLVGPRPPLASEVANYDQAVSRRLRVKPGITGLWQVSGRSDLSWEESVRLDLYYVENWSLTLDLIILARTARAVLSGAGAY